MSCEDYKQLLMAYIDDEIDEKDRECFEEHIRQCERCRSELAELKNLKEVTDDMVFKFPEDKLWATYWSGVYNRLERGAAWALVSVGAIILIVYGVYALLVSMLGDVSIPWAVKIGVILLLAGVVALIVSTARERLFAYKSDKYKEVER
ncbi:MAG: zf-HC2 domain-containing protein [Planctomycetota bacterium]